MFEDKKNRCWNLLKFTCDGKALKDATLNVAVYASAKFFGMSYFPDEEILPQEKKLAERTERVQYYISNNTNWNLVASYADFTDVTANWYSDKNTERDFLDLREELSELIDDTYERKFDVVVVNSISQISRDIRDVFRVLRLLRSNDVVIFCIDSESILTLDDRILNTNLPDKVTIDSLYNLSSSHKSSN